MQKLKKERIILLIIISTLLIFIILGFTYFFNNNKNILKSNNKILKDLPTISYYYEDENGDYVLGNSNAFISGYVLDETLSGCENGGTLTYNASTNKVEVETSRSDKCYLYFMSAPDLKLNVNYSGDKSSLKFANATKTLDCGVTWDNKLGGVTSSITGLSSTIECGINVVENNSTTYLNTYITGLSGTTQGTGQVVSENGYRYEGKNPNNYVWFNDELWRIIGVFDSTSHGQSGKNLVKIIRADSIGGLAWHKSNTNDWVNSSLKALLNGAYYDWNTNSSSAATNCYGYSTTVSTTCDYSQKGIKDGYRSMIQNVTWYLGGGGKSGYTTYTPDSVYGYERNSAAIYSGRSASTTGNIGLMYESDYLYGVLASSSCARTRDHGSYNTAACAGSNWLYSNGYEWTITPVSNYSDGVWNITSYGNIISNNRAYNGYAVRPVLYLSSSVHKIDGDGSKSNPYIIGM